jgi:hypothetical protein
MLAFEPGDSELNLSDVACTCLYEEAEMLQFAQLLNILVRDEKNVIFFCERLNTVQFNNHFHAWHVQ